MVSFERDSPCITCPGYRSKYRSDGLSRRGYLPRLAHVSRSGTRTLKHSTLRKKSSGSLSFKKFVRQISRPRGDSRPSRWKKEKKRKKKKINKNSEKSSIILRQYSKANVVFAYVRRSFVYRVKISFHRGLFQKWVIRDEKAKVRFKVEILDV